MFSQLNSSIVYEDVSPDIREHDVNVVSDLWSMGGREVYRGSRDPRYTHANVYWLYDEELQRVGLAEHDRTDNARFHLLWMEDNEFGTLLQEEGWKRKDSLFAYLPDHVAEKFLAEGWTTPGSFLAQCIQGPTRIITPAMLIRKPIVTFCSGCKVKSFGSHPSSHPSVQMELDIPNREKVFFVDDDLVVHVPPTDSSVWDRLLTRPLRDGGSPSLPEQAQVPRARTHTDASPPESPALPGQDTPDLRIPTLEEHPPQAVPASPHQSHPQTPVQP
jgi:hypothetical protein